MFATNAVHSAIVDHNRDVPLTSAAPTSTTALPKPLHLETLGLSRSIAGKILVNNISLQIQAGEVLAIVGPSGAGKSSFLRLLNRLDEPTGGTVTLNGNDYRGIAPKELRRRIGMVMQTAYLFPGTVGANVAFGPRQCGTNLSAEQIDALLERVGVPHYRDRDVGNLSGGEAQRVSLARTLANTPEALLLDEPTSALDVSVQAEILNLLRRLHRERNLTMILVSHNLAVVGFLCSRVGVMRNGEIVEQRDIEAIRAQQVEHEYTRSLLLATTGYQRKPVQAIGADAPL
jgi:ABC-type methionine transport system ATPase subunit